MVLGTTQIIVAIVQVILAGVLAYYTKELYNATSRYADYLKDQNDIIEFQKELMGKKMKYELLHEKMSYYMKNAMIYIRKKMAY